jgi:AcrR family transcriptional regulator
MAPTARSAEPTGTVRAPRRDALRNDRRVLEAAFAVFAEQGPQAGMEDIAARAGVGVGTIYRRFSSKDALLDALAVEIADEIERAVTEAVADDDPERGLTTFLEFVGELNVAKRRLSPVLVARVGDSGVTATVSGLVATLTGNAVRAGALAADVTPDDVLALVKALAGVVASTEGGEDWHRFLRIHLAGLRATR